MVVASIEVQIMSSPNKPENDEANPDMTNEPASQENPSDDVAAAPGFWQTMMSVIAAAFGVQSAANRERDFSKGNPLVFIAAGLIFTVVFVLTIIGAVYLIL